MGVKLQQYHPIVAVLWTTLRKLKIIYQMKIKILNNMTFYQDINQRGKEEVGNTDFC
jgi:hypothetical protein